MVHYIYNVVKSNRSADTNFEANFSSWSLCIVSRNILSSVVLTFLKVLYAGNMTFIKIW